jgi:hypothetical protein
MFCSCFVVIVVLCIFILVCTSVGLLPPDESPIAAIIIIIIIINLLAKSPSLTNVPLGSLMEPLKNKCLFLKPSYTCLSTSSEKEPSLQGPLTELP